MKRVHVIGGKNHGKTTLIMDLIRELTARGLQVGTIKHTHHKHELDIPGKDSYRHRESGASACRYSGFAASRAVSFSRIRADFPERPRK